MGATLSSIIGLFDGSPMRGLAVGLRVGTSGVGIALGPVIGGILLQRFAWDSVFWVCAVIGTLAICRLPVPVRFHLPHDLMVPGAAWVFGARDGDCHTAVRGRHGSDGRRHRPRPGSRHRRADDGRAGQRGRYGQCRHRGTIRELSDTLGVGIMGSLQAGTYTTGLTDALRGSYLPQDILGASKESVMAAESISGSLPGTLRRLPDDSVASATMILT